MSRFRRLAAHMLVTYALGSARGSSEARVVDPTLVSALSARIGDACEAPTRALPRAEHGDASLVAAALAGERAAEEILYRRHAPSVLRLATRLLGSKEDASDVLQDAFVSAFEDLRALRDPHAFRRWVHRIAVRLVHRRFRRRRFLALLGLDKTTDDVRLESLADATASAETRVELRLLDGALARVDARQRIAWMLRYVEGSSLEEVAEACECSLATVKRRIAAVDVVVRRHFEGGRS